MFLGKKIVYRNDGLAKYLRCIVVIFTLCCYDVCGVRVVVRRSSYDVYDVRHTMCTMAVIRRVLRPSYSEHFCIKPEANRGNGFVRIK